MAANDTLKRTGVMLLSGDVEVVDLAVPLGEKTPLIKLPPPFKNTPAIKVHTISNYDEDGPYWAWNWLELGEHSGTHFDAPVALDHRQGLQATARPTSCRCRSSSRPVNVIDCSKETAADEDFLLTADGVKAWEKQHGDDREGRVGGDAHRLAPAQPQRGGVPERRDNMPHSPGPTVDCIEYLIGKGIVGWGTETVGTDAGKAGTFDPPYPAHNLLHKNNRYGLASLANLDKLPPKGAILIAAPLKFVNGTGSPIRALALVPKR